MTSTLPLEILYHVFDALAEENERKAISICSFPFHVFGALTSLQRLKIGGRRLDTYGEVLPGTPSLTGNIAPEPNYPLRLEHLSISGTAAVGIGEEDPESSPKLVLDYQSIRKCTITIGFFDQPTMVKGILGRMSGLVSLSLDIDNKDIEDLFSTLHTDTFSTLRNLEASLRRRISSESTSNGGDMFLGLFNALSYFPKENSLTSITVNATEYDFESCRIGSTVECSDWGMLKAVLISSTFPCLRTVKVRYGIVDYSLSGRCSELVDWLRGVSFKVLRGWVSDVSFIISYLHDNTGWEWGVYEPPPVEYYTVE